MRALVSQLSIHKLEVFCLVAELGSVSRAAERIGIAQPVVSAHLRALSEKLGAPLTTRIGRRVALTEEGRTVYRWAREMVVRTRELEREIADFQRGVLGKASVGASMSFGSYVLPALVAAFHARHSEGHVSVRVTNPPGVTQAVQDGDCDFAFTILDERHDVSELEVERVAYEHLALVVSDWTEVADDRLSSDELAKIPFVTAQSGTARREIEESLLTRIGVKRERIRMEFGHAEAIKQAVRAGAGAAFLFRSSVRDELSAGTLRIVATPGLDLRVPVYRVRRKGKHLSGFQSALMEDLTLALGAREAGQLPDTEAKGATGPDSPPRARAGSRAGAR